MSRTWTQTFTGKMMYPLAPTADMINIFDIAHQSSIEPRYSGATFFPYSVAQHSILVADIIDILLDNYEAYQYAYGNMCRFFSQDIDVRNVLRSIALLHDATEAYLKDMPKPIKDVMPDYTAYEHKLELLIYNKYLNDITNVYPDGYGLARAMVKDADIIALLTERGQILGPPPAAWLDDFSAYFSLDIPVTYMSWDLVEQNFLNKAASLGINY